MASPVDTSVKWFSSKMAGSPIRNATAGSYISGLDACLVTGWGVQTASSVVVSGGVCTATFPFTHAALLHSVVLVAGASKSELNGEQKVTATGLNTVSWATDATNGTDTGTVTVKMAPLGFSKVFAGTNIAVYRSTDPRSNGHFLRVSDTGATTARVVGYENMTAVSTGTGPFPTSAQRSGGSTWGKGLTASAEPMDWFLVGDSMFFYTGSSAFQAYGSSYADYLASTFDYFGDPLSNASGVDAFCTLVSTPPGAASDDWQYYGGAHAAGLSPGGEASFSPRAATGVGTSVVVGSAAYSPSNSSTPIATGPGRLRLGSVMAACPPAAMQAARADYPGLLVSHQTFSAPMPTHGLPIRIGVGPETDALMIYLVLSYSVNTAFNPVFFDIVGPWR